MRLAFRSLRSSPIVSLLAVLSLALGIGANTAIFSLIDGLFAWSVDDFALNTRGERQAVQGAWVSDSFFDTLGVTPLIGRTFRADAAAADKAVVVVSYGFWQRRFGGAADAIGRTLTLNDAAFTIVGVMATCAIRSRLRPVPRAIHVSASATSVRS